MTSLLAVLMLAAPPLGDDPAAVLDDFHDAASKADEARYFGLFAPEGVFVGTDATEVWTVEAFRAYAHPHFSKGRGWTYHPDKKARRIEVRGDVAWFYEPLAHEKYGALRGSGTLVRRDGQWKVAQYVLSFAVPNDAADGVVERIRNPAK
jgi:hypothetical protein